LGEVLVDFPALAKGFFPEDGSDNLVICCTNHTQVPFIVQMTDQIPDAAVGGRGGHCFPFYIYTDAKTRIENVTDWSLELFRKHYKDQTISKWDIFYYAYGVLHSPKYRDEFSANLRKSLHRIPLAKSLALYREAGKALAALHVGYETSVPYPLKVMETKGKPLSFAVSEKMRLTPGGSGITVNESPTLEGIPADAHRYKLGNRSALEWIISQYHSADNDPNREADEEYVTRLIGQVVQVGIDTVAITDTIDQ
jgi:predicted helicase